MSIRVLQIVWGMERGGIESLLMNVYRNIDKDKVQFDFLMMRMENGVFDEEIIAMGGKTYNLPSLEQVGYQQYKKNLLTFFKEHPEYQIVHIHRDMASGLDLMIAKKAGVPIRIVHSHNTQTIRGNNLIGVIKVVIKKTLKLLIKPSATHYFACGKEAGKWLYGDKICKEKLVVISNGIDIEEFTFKDELRKKIRKQLQIDEDTYLVGHVGQFERQKNHKFVLEIFKALLDKHEHAKLCLIGKGSKMEEVKQLIQQLNLQEQVNLVGSIPNVNEYMMAFDVLLFPSLHEGLPFALIEAQCTGLPCIVSDVITDEVKLINEQIKMLNLEDHENIWVDQLLNTKKCDLKGREGASRRVKDCRYDIKDTAQWLQTFYSHLEI